MSNWYDVDFPETNPTEPVQNLEITYNCTTGDPVKKTVNIFVLKIRIRIEVKSNFISASSISDWSK